MKSILKILSIIVLGIVFIFPSCTGDRGGIPASVVNVPNSASGEKIDGLPQFQFTVAEHDFGKVIQGERVTFAFKFRNSGDADLVIANISATCGCTATEYPKTPIKPGEENTIKVTFDSAGKEGFQHKTITIAANTQPSTVELALKAMVFRPEKKN